MTRLHPSGHTRSAVRAVREAARMGTFSFGDVADRDYAAMALLILNGRIEPIDGGPIPEAWAHPSVRYRLSERGRQVLARADAAERRTAALPQAAE